MWFNAPLEIDGVTETGLVLHGECYVDQPEQHVSFELRISRVPGRRYVPLSRVDWRSLSGHSNVRNGPHEWSGKPVSETHFHDFELNYLPEHGRMKGGSLPFAREIEASLGTFAELRSYAGKAFRINNIDVVLVPEWEYKLI